MKINLQKACVYLVVCVIRYVYNLCVLIFEFILLLSVGSI